ncbi:hypothetical protein [Mycolicibacterium neworleansense]|uniref:hypothetical protein n=1 Tax=Mycolicibacterium neworleansense TaxID=146018 RepID=UPI001F453BAC|nr:hypothetical protein [Mycolicibacterium neworleansense]
MRIWHQRDMRVHERHRGGLLRLLDGVVVDMAGEVHQLGVADAVRGHDIDSPDAVEAFVHPVAHDHQRHEVVRAATLDRWV